MLKCVLTEGILVLQDGYLECHEFVQALSVTSRGNVEEKLQCAYTPINDHEELHFYSLTSIMLGNSVIEHCNERSVTANY